MTHDDPTRGDIVLYQTDDGRTRIRCRFEDQSLWLTQALIADLSDDDIDRKLDETRAHVARLGGSVEVDAPAEKYKLIL